MQKCCNEADSLMDAFNETGAHPAFAVAPCPLPAGVGGHAALMNDSVLGLIATGLRKLCKATEELSNIASSLVTKHDALKKVSRCLAARQLFPSLSFTI